MSLARHACVRPRLCHAWTSLGVLLTLVLGPGAVAASPAMIRLGYAGCQACHLSPQGRGLLTDYGKGMDDTHSARRGVYDAGERRRRVFHDVRLMTQLTSEAREAPERVTAAALRAWYRNSTRVSNLVRVSGTISADLPARPREVTPVQPLPSQPQVFLRQMLLEVTPRHDMYLAVGRDTLPSGVEIADQATYMRAHNVQGLTDVPTQVKLFWWRPRFQIAPYAFGPSGHEHRPFRTSGVGVVAETYLLGDRLATGVSLRRARNRTVDERLTGVHARLGMGRWGVLTEHALVQRRERTAARREFGQYTSYVQVFFYPTDWLVASISADRLQVESPYDDRRWYVRPELSARLSPYVTLAASIRSQHRQARRSTALVVQLYLKTVD